MQRTFPLFCLLALLIMSPQTSLPPSTTAPEMKGLKHALMILWLFLCFTPLFYTPSKAHRCGLDAPVRPVGALHFLSIIPIIICALSYWRRGGIAGTPSGSGGLREGPPRGCRHQPKMSRLQTKNVNYTKCCLIEKILYLCRSHRELER